MLGREKRQRGKVSIRRGRSPTRRKVLGEKQLLVQRAVGRGAALHARVGVLAEMTVNMRVTGEDRREKRKTNEDWREGEVEVKRVVDIGPEVVHHAVTLVKVIMKGLKIIM